MIWDRRGINCHAPALTLTLTLTITITLTFALLLRSSSSPTSHSKVLLISARALCPFRIAPRAMAAHTRLHRDSAFHSLSIKASYSKMEKRKYVKYDRRNMVWHDMARHHMS